MIPIGVQIVNVTNIPSMMNSSNSSNSTNLTNQSNNTANTNNTASNTNPTNITTSYNQTIIQYSITANFSNMVSSQTRWSVNNGATFANYPILNSWSANFGPSFTSISSQLNSNTTSFYIDNNLTSNIN